MRSANLEFEAGTSQTALAQTARQVVAKTTFYVSAAVPPGVVQGAFLYSPADGPTSQDPAVYPNIYSLDFASCVDITTRGALRNMVLPGVLAVVFPIIVGLVLKKEAMAAFLMVGTISGIILATLLNNAGGAWDNAKKYIETGVHGGKRSEAHKAAVVGDTVGDPFKDTAGPSLHVLIKLLATITLVMAPLFLS